MVQACRQCTRTNPDEALYCYYDGFLLAHHRTGWDLPANMQPFPRPLVFASGQSCQNFDQLALLLHENWTTAHEFLRQGYLEPFLGGLGRADLAAAAQEAAHAPDPERGLDAFLARIPSPVLKAPLLQVEPGEINLGPLQIGQDRRFELTLTNQGMRLVFGSVGSDCLWLTLGDGGAVSQKVLQFTDTSTLTVHVLGQHLRASNKPLEGRLLFETNGGSLSVLVRGEVPIQPFEQGVLAGARSPRQIIEKTRAHPRAAAILFETGAVADWYKRNGWPYPVPGPSATGLDSIRQFFQALGLANDPLVAAPPGPQLRPPGTVYPFPEGVLARARSPRELVEKIRPAPQEAAALFEKGAVAEWYARNGWVYPVTGPVAAGLDGVRQFFTALGLKETLAGAPPPTVLPAPVLHVPVPEIVLGPLRVGQDVSFSLELINAGTGTLVGSMVSDCPWLTLGDPPGSPETPFEFSVAQSLPVRVLGRLLRAGCQPLEGRLAIRSNGGSATLLVRAAIPIQPFGAGILEGARSPRELVEKTRAAPAEAAPLFENGAVAAWYTLNGWVYPVQAPAAMGQDAVHQFLKALGLTKPLSPVSSRTRISQQVIHLHGQVGQRLEHVLTAKARGHRPRDAQASSDQPWLGVGPTKLDDGRATILLVIPAVPNCPGETLHARVNVTVNGQQQFVFPVTLEVGGSRVAQG